MERKNEKKHVPKQRVADQRNPMRTESENRDPQYKGVYSVPPALTTFDLMNTCFGKNVEMEIENSSEWSDRA